MQSLLFSVASHGDLTPWLILWAVSAKRWCTVATYRNRLSWFLVQRLQHKTDNFCYSTHMNCSKYSTMKVVQNNRKTVTELTQTNDYSMHRKSCYFL